VRLNIMQLALLVLCKWNRNLLREMRDVLSMNAVRCQHVLAVTCTDGGLGLGLQKSLYPFAMFTSQSDTTCSHDLINDVMLDSAVMNTLLNVVLSLYSNYITLHEKVKVKVAI